MSTGVAAGACIAASTAYLNGAVHWRILMLRRIRALLVAGLTVSAAAVAPVHAETVGQVGVDWLGNDIKIDAVSDPKVTGVTCHVTYFDRSVIDRLKNGNWFEDPSNNSIACRQTGPIAIGDIDLSKEGEEVFRSGLSLIWKNLLVTRIYDKANDTLIYLAHSRQLTDGSAKMSITTVPLYGQPVTWENGRPE
jgi:CreA protein